MTFVQRDSLIVGAGPSGLSAALALARGGAAPLVLEASHSVGGLMRSLRESEHVLDLGRKELYTRFPEVNTLWEEILGNDYRAYPHRVGSLYRGRIVELSGRFRGPTRGMPAAWLFAGGLAMLGGWAAGSLRRPKSLQDYWHHRVGPVFARILAQGYWEKFRGRRWADLPPPETDPGSGYSLGVIGQAMRVARRGGVQTQAEWRHPARGTGQLFEGMAGAVRRLGGAIEHGVEVALVSPLADDCIEVEVRAGAETRHYRTRHLVTSLSIERFWELMPGGASAGPATPAQPAERQVILVYLFFDEPPRFPHAWLEVNDPDLPCGRITNYAAFQGSMVPEGRCCLCVETFLDEASPPAVVNESAQVAQALDAITAAGLASLERLTGAHVLQLSRTNAAASWREAQSVERRRLVQALACFPAIYHVNRPGSDWACLAGLLAGEAILKGDRRTFDARADPTRRHVEAENDGGGGGGHTSWAERPYATDRHTRRPPFP